MADLARIKRNVAKMAGMNAPEQDIDGYIQSEGVTVEDIRNFKLKSEQAQVQKKQPSQDENSFISPAAVEKRQQELGRSLGLGARAIGQGISAPLTIPADLLALGINKATGSNIEPLSSVVSSGLTALGLPEPATRGERIASDVVEGATGGAGIAKGIQTLGKGAPKFIQQLGLNPAIDAVAGGIGAGAASTVREAGGGTGQQIAAGLIGGLGGGAVATKIGSSVKAGIKETPSILQDVAERGIENPAAFVNVRESVKQEAAKESRKLFGINGKDGVKIEEGLFDIAEKRGDKAFLSPQPIRDFAEEIAKESDIKIGKAPSKLLKSVSDRLLKLAEPEGLNLITLTRGAEPKITLNQIQAIRRELTAISKEGTSEAAIAGQLNKRIDKLLIDNFDKMTGDKEALEIWQQAIKGRREFAQKFEEPAQIAKALERDSKGELLRTNEEIEQAFIGSGGASLNKKLSRVYDDTLNALPEEQKVQAGFQLRQSIINRMIKNSAQSVDDAEGLSASRLANQIRNFRRDNKSMWDKFSQPEREILSSLENELRKTTKGGVINKVYNSLERFLSRASGSNIELPRTLKPKTVVTIDDLIELTNVRPRTQLPAAGLAGGSLTGSENDNP